MEIAVKSKATQKTNQHVQLNISTTVLMLNMRSTTAQLFQRLSARWTLFSLHSGRGLLAYADMVGILCKNSEMWVPNLLYHNLLHAVCLRSNLTLQTCNACRLSDQSWIYNWTSAFLIGNLWSASSVCKLARSCAWCCFVPKSWFKISILKTLNSNSCRPSFLHCVSCILKCWPLQFVATRLTFSQATQAALSSQDLPMPLLLPCW